MEWVYRIVKLGDYGGLPPRFLIESKFGWFSGTSFSTKLSFAFVFETEERAVAVMNELYPTWERDKPK